MGIIILKDSTRQVHKNPARNMTSEAWVFSKYESKTVEKTRVYTLNVMVESIVKVKFVAKIPFSAKEIALL